MSVFASPMLSSRLTNICWSAPLICTRKQDKLLCGVFKMSFRCKNSKCFHTFGATSFVVNKNEKEKHCLIPSKVLKTFKNASKNSSSINVRTKHLNLCSVKYLNTKSNTSKFIISQSLAYLGPLKNRKINWQTILQYSTDSRQVTPIMESWEMLVDYTKLSATEIQIHECHRDAVKQKQLMYVDPETGYYVMTRLVHIERGECCGSACRHCPFGQRGVTDEKNKRKFNTAFYVDNKQ